MTNRQRPLDLLEIYMFLSDPWCDKLNVLFLNVESNRYNHILCITKGNREPTVFLCILTVTERWHGDDSLAWWESASARASVLQPILHGGNRVFGYRKSCDIMNLFSLCVFLWFQGAFWGLMVGLVGGVCRMVLEFVYPSPGCGVVDTAPAVLRGVHYLHFAILLCGLTAGVVAVISLLTPPPTNEQVGSRLHRKQQRFRRSVLLVCLCTCNSGC